MKLAFDLASAYTEALDVVMTLENLESRLTDKTDVKNEKGLIGIIPDNTIVVIELPSGGTLHIVAGADTFEELISSPDGDEAHLIDVHVKLITSMSLLGYSYVVFDDDAETDDEGEEDDLDD